MFLGIEYLGVRYIRWNHNGNPIFPRREYWNLFINSYWEILGNLHQECINVFYSNPIDKGM
jgi:hypothetical protein